MRRPILLNRPSLASSADGDTLDGQTSPPATWEDRADTEFDNSANWMDTGEHPSHVSTRDPLDYSEQHIDGACSHSLQLTRHLGSHLTCT